uniref:Retrotransposon gag domain-containing protein n=1 Tax=Brassica oleracea var. oleracea TaxID=109376 RepID=A0A0D3E7G6_BRAOL
MTTILTRLDPQNQQVANVQNLPIQPPRDQHRPPPPHQIRPQQQLPPPQQQDLRQQHRNQHQYPPEDDEDDQHCRVFFEDLRQRDRYDHCWENSFKVDIPEFHGGLRGDDLVDWIMAVEEILDFKQVPPARRVSLVAMRFCGHAATWWKQLKTTRSRMGKTPIQSWEKLTKHLRQTFFPHSYKRTMYTKLQNLCQENRSVDEYAEEFALLLTRNEINDSQVQLVSRFIGGLRPQLQTVMTQFDPSTIGEAHRRATSLEQQSRSSNWNTPSNRNRSQDQAGSTTPTTSSKEATDTANSSTKPIGTRRTTRHRQTACPHATRRGLLIDDATQELDVYDSQEENDQDNDDIHPTTGDSGHLLVLRRTCLTPRRLDDKWLRTNIFAQLVPSKDVSAPLSLTPVAAKTSSPKRP